MDSTAEQDEDGQDALILDESDPAPRSTPPSRAGSSRTPPPEHGDSAAPTAAEVSASPPHDTKVRLISRGVKDLNWKSLGSASAKLAFEPPEHDAAADEPEGMEVENPSSEDDISHKETIVPVGSNPPDVNDDPVGDDEHEGAADPVEQPQSAQVDSEPPKSSSVAPPVPFPGTSNPSPPPSPPSSGSPRPHALLPSALEDDVKSGQKRKLGDRTVSERHIPGDIGERKGKRVSPPPTVAESEEQAESQEVAKPKPVGCLFFCLLEVRTADHLMAYV